MRGVFHMDHMCHMSHVLSLISLTWEYECIMEGEERSFFHFLFFCFFPPSVQFFFLVGGVVSDSQRHNIIHNLLNYLNLELLNPIFMV